MVNRKWLLAGLCLAMVMCFFGSARAESATSAKKAPEKLSILVVGDSLGNGVYSGLYRLARTDPKLSVNKISKVGSGLTSFSISRWERQLPGLIAKYQPNVAVVVTGGNDPQPLLLRKGKKRFAFKSDDWLRFYRQRIDTLIESLAQRGINTFWVGMPIMRKAEYDRDIQYITQVIRDQVLDHNAVFIPLRDLTADEKGKYNAFGKDLSGRMRRLRANDGKHFTPDGYDLLSNHILRVILDSMNKGAGSAS